MAKMQSKVEATVKERAARKDLIGHAKGKITEMNESANKDGGKACRVLFPTPVGEKTVYISGRGIKSRNLKVGTTTEFSCFELEDNSLEFTLRVTTADDARSVFRK